MYYTFEGVVGLYFKKKFSKRPPPSVIVEIITNKNFNQSLESYCTSLSSKTKSYKIKKNELLEPIKFDVKVKKGDIIAKLVTKNISAPFGGIVGKRGISGSSLGSENTIIFPNPATHFISIDRINFSDGNIQFNISDISGKEVVQIPHLIKNTVDVSNLSSGLYFVNIDDGKQKITKKLIIE